MSKLMIKGNNYLNQKSNELLLFLKLFNIQTCNCV